MIFYRSGRVSVAIAYLIHRNFGLRASPPFSKWGLGDWTFGALKNAVDPHPSLRATLSHKEREKNKWRCDPNRRFVPRRCDWGDETSVCSLEVSAPTRASLPRPWGEGGRRPGEGQPKGIAPQNVQTLDPPFSKGAL